MHYITTGQRIKQYIGILLHKHIPIRPEYMSIIYKIPFSTTMQTYNILANLRST